MDLSQVLKQCKHLAQPYRIHDGDGFRLKQIDPGDTQDLPADKKAAREALEQGIELLSSSSNGSMPRTSGRSCWFFKPWMPRGKTARSSTS